MKNRRYREVAKRSLAICLLAALLLAGTAVGEVSREGLVGEWHFDEGTGNIVKDSTGNRNNGIIYGATYVNGVSGNALSFDGVDDYVEFSYDTDFTPGSNSWTIEAWVKTIDSSKDIDIISWYRCGANPDCNTPDSAIYELFINNDGKAGWKVGDDNGNSYQITSPSPITDNKWHFLTATFSSSSDYMKLYVDGKLSNDKSATLTTLSAGTIPIPLEIGRVYRKGWAPSGSYFIGIIDEVRIYNRALTASEIKELYDADSGGKVVPTPPTTTVDTSPPGGCPTSSAVLLHGEKTDVVLGEDILLKLSAVNLITKPPMSVQVMIYPPSGMSVTSSDFVKSGAGIYTATYTLNPGDGKDIEVHIQSNQVGDFNVKGRIVYYFGEDKNKAEDCTLNLPIKVRTPPPPTPTATVPGFEGGIATIGIFFAALFILKRK